MVLPLLPVIEDVRYAESTSAPLSKHGFRAIGQFLLHGDVGDIDKFVDQIPAISTDFDVVVDIDDLSSPDQVIRLLDSGAAKVVVTKLQLADLSEIPPDRLLARLSKKEVDIPAEVEEVANSVSGIILESTFALGVGTQSLKSIVSSLRKAYLPTGGERTLYLEYSKSTPPPTMEELKSLAALSIQPILPAQCLTSSPKDHPSLLSVAQIALLSATTDRPDGLYSTVIVNERGHALGLVYSSLESITESIRTGTGVYQSRTRGLWYKGATSGATQNILGMSWDCDTDCLCYTVNQTGKGISCLFLLI